MCGIVGGVSDRNVLPILIEGLKRLEYRGYDSAGVAFRENSKISLIKAKGRVLDLENKLPEKKIKSNQGIAHTRWATHGVPSEKNAHPQISENKIFVVHNGIIENHLNLREKLQSEGVKFRSDTDTEVIIFTGTPDQRMKHLAAELADITKSKTESGIQIMGLSSWNNSTSILSEPAFQNSWFTMPDYRFRKFYENKFIKKFGYRPHPKSNLTYDAIAALGVLEKNLKNKNINHSNKFDDLFNSSGFIGIDGIFRFNYDRIAEKELSVIQITNGQPKVLKQARNSFP